MGQFLAEKFELFQVPIVANPYFCHTDFAPAGVYAAGHVLEVIVVKKDTLQVVDDHIDRPIGRVPNLAVVCSPGGGDTDMHMGLFKVWDTGLCFLGDGFVNHLDPVFLHFTG